MANEKITLRFKDLTCSESDKKVLHAYLFSCLAEGRKYRLKRNRVMIMEKEQTNKYVILDTARTSDENRLVYLCPKCFPVRFGEFLSGTISAENFKSCLHTRLCYLIWGDENNIEINVVDNDEEEDLVEVIEQKPRYMAVIHPSRKSTLKGPGVVVISSKMLKPKCIVCPGQDCCIHLKIHLNKYKHQMEETNEESHKRLKIDKVEPVRPQKKKIKDPEDFDPFQHEGPNCNVFNVKIEFIQTEEMMLQNRKNNSSISFKKNILISKYDPEEVCEKHGNMFKEKENILLAESSRVVIHHTKWVETRNICVLYRQTVSKDDDAACDCKRFYTGEDDRLLRVSSAKYRISERERVLHFVSYEFYFTFTTQLITGGETMHAYIKSQKFMNERFFGCDKSPEHKKVLHKGFEIFCHALQFPSDSNYCYDCPQALGEDEKEDDFSEEIEYSIIDGIQMGRVSQN